MEKLKFYSGSFNGLFRKDREVHKGKFNFNKIRWEYVNIQEITACQNLNFEELKAGAYYFTPILKARTSKWENLTGINTSVFIPHDTNHIYSGDLNNFLVRDIETASPGIPKIKKVNHDLYQITGKAFFSVIDKPINEGAVDLNPGFGEGQNTFGTIYLPTPKSSLSNITSTITALLKRKNNNRSLNTTVNTSHSGGCLSQIITMLMGAIVGLLLYYLWYSNYSLFGLLLGLVILWILGKLFNKSFWSNIGGWGILLFVIYYFQNNKHFVKSELKPQKTEEGSIKQFPPVEDTNNPDPSVRDFLNKKQLDWWDFLNKSYSITYATSSVNYRKSTENRVKSTAISTNDETQYYSAIYEKLNNFDQKFLDSFYAQIRAQKKQKKLTLPQTAEMVVTMIQEIPYVLVHDMSCEKVVANSENDFIKEYHEEKKPCLPNISAGVQSPYEFAHNLKGDCDTRALLGFSILKKLNIPTSIWISTVYGHSVLGIGLPTQGSNFKTLNGVKHYAVELTAKGYRLGMIAPEHRNMNNWIISNYHN